MSIKLSPTAIIREAKRIKTTPSVLATRALKFKGKPDCERLVRFIKSSGEELSKVSIPNSKSLVKGMGGGGKDGGLGDITSNDLLMNAISAAMYPGATAVGGLLGGGLGLGVGALGLGALGLGGGKIMKGTRNILSKGKDKLLNAGKGVKNFFGKGGDEVLEGVAKKSAKKVGTKVAAKTAKATTSKAMGALPLIGNLWDLGSAAYRFSKGDTVGGLLSLGSAIPIAGWGFAAIDIARDGGAFEKTPLKNKKEEEKEEIQEDRDAEKVNVKEKETDNKEKQRIDGVINKFDSVVDKYSVKGKSFGAVSKLKKWFGFNEGGKVPGSGNRDTVPAMLTPGEIVMSKPAVDKIGADNLLAMNAAGGGTNKPTVSGGYNKGGVVTDPEEKKQQEAYMLKYVNEERALQGLEPLKNLTYAKGVELTKKMGSEYYGGGVEEESHTDMDFDNMIKTTSESKTRGDESIMRGSMGLLTEKDKEEYLAANPDVKQMLHLKEQLELNALGADISASAKMNGGGLVQGFNGGGLVQGFQGGGSVKFSGSQLKGLLDSQKGIGQSPKPPAMDVTSTKTLGPNTPLPSPGWGRRGGFTPTPMWQKPSPSGGSGSWGTSIKLAKQNRPVGTIENEGVIINNIPSPQPAQQGGGSQMIPVPVGGGSQPQSSPPMPSYFQIVNSIRISSLLTKLSIT